MLLFTSLAKGRYLKGTIGRPIVISNADQNHTVEDTEVNIHSAHGGQKDIHPLKDVFFFLTRCLLRDGSGKMPAQSQCLGRSANEDYWAVLRTGLLDS